LKEIEDELAVIAEDIEIIIEGGIAGLNFQRDPDFLKKRWRADSRMIVNFPSEEQGMEILR